MVMGKEALASVAQDDPVTFVKVAGFHFQMGMTDTVLAEAIAAGRVKPGQRVRFARWKTPEEAEAENIDPTQQCP